MLIPEDGTGRPDADSFCTLEYANAYNSGHLDSDTWAFEGTSIKEKAIRLATRRISDGYVFFGRRRSPSQALEWPRVGATDQGGWPIPANLVPQSVRMATAELARRLIVEFNTGALSDDSSTGAVKQVTVGPIGIAFDTATAGTKVQPEVPDDVAAMLKHLGYPTRGAGRMGRLIR